MNKIYKVIWSKVKHQYVVVSELAHRDGKRSSTATKSSWRAMAAALMLTGSLVAVPYTGDAAEGAATTAGQYIAVAVDGNDTYTYTEQKWVDGYFDREHHRWVEGHYEDVERTGTYEEGDTRTFEDASGVEHNYTWVNVTDDKGAEHSYWVREGYTITIKDEPRFETDNPKIPEDTYIIDSEKHDNADDEGLISSSEALITDDTKHTTLTGNELNKIEAGIYGGAVNSGGTNVPKSFNYYINDNGKGYKDVGDADSWDKFNNFKLVYQQSDGTYNTSKNGRGTTVSSEDLYVIDGKLGAFFNSNGTVYTGDVFGLNNEILMTGQDEKTGNYYSYWGTKINDPNASMSNMTMGDHEKIVKALQENIYIAQGDDIKNINVAKAEKSNGGTIGLTIRGDYIGDDEEGNPIYKDTAPVPGTITIRNTDSSGKDGNDVAIQFGSIDEQGQDVKKFTLNAGSTVVGTVNGEKASEDATLDGININGINYKLGGGETYTDSDGININNDNEVSVNADTTKGLGFAETADTNGTKKLEVKIDDTNSNLQFNDAGEISLNQDLTLNSVTTGNVVMDTKGVGIVTGTGDETKTNYYITADGLDANSQKITNVAAGDVTATSTDAVNGSQLYSVQQEASKHTTMTVNGGTDAPAVPEGQTTSDYTGGNLQLKQTVTDGQTEYDVKFNDDLYLGGDQTEDSHTIALNGSTGAIQATASAEDASASFAFDSDGVVITSGAGETATSTTISGQQITAGNVMVNAETGKDTITGLSNTTWSSDETWQENNVVANRAATEGQLSQLDDRAVKYDLTKGENPTVDYDKVTLSGDEYKVTTGEGGKSYEGGTRLTNVAYADVNGTGTGSDAVNVDLLKNYVAENGGESYTASDGIAINDDNEVSVNAGDGLGFAETTAEGETTRKLEVKLDDTNDNLQFNNAGEVSLNQDLTLNSVTTGNVVMGTKGVGIVTGTGDETKTNYYITANGLDANSQKITNVADGTIDEDSTDAVNGSQLYDVQLEASKHTTMTVNGGTAAPAIPQGQTTSNYTDGNLQLKQSVGADGQTEYDVKLNDDVYLGGNQTANNSNIALEGSTGSIHAATTEGNHTFDFDRNGGKFETTTEGFFVDTIHTSVFDEDGATFTNTRDVGLLQTSTSTNIDGSTITSNAGLSGGQTIINGAYINAGGIEVNGEFFKDTITGLSNTEWKNDEIWQKAHIRDDRAATEGQLQDVADSLSGDVSKLNDFAVKYDEVKGEPDYSKVTLEGKGGTKITNLAKGDVNATSTDAVNGSQLFEVKELAGKPSIRL